MEEEIRTTDPNSQKKKLLFVTLICSLIGLTVLVFCVFGYLLNNYLHFEANKTQAENDLIDARERINRYKKDVQVYQNDALVLLDQKKSQMEKLNESIAERQAKIAAQQNNVNEYSTLSKKLELLKKDYRSTLEEYQDISTNLGKTKGFFSQLKIQVESLNNDKKIIKNKIDKLSKQKLLAEKTLALVESDVIDKNKEFDVISLKITKIEKKHKKTYGNFISLKKELSEINDQLTKVKQENKFYSEQQNTLTNEVKNLETQTKILSQSILVFTNNAAAKSKAIEEAEKIIVKKKSDIELLKKNITQLENKVFSLKNKYDTVNAKVILAQETIAAKKKEKKDVEADILELKKRKMDLSFVIDELEDRQIQLNSQLKKANKDAPTSD